MGKHRASNEPGVGKGLVVGAGGIATSDRECPNEVRITIVVGRESPAALGKAAVLFGSGGKRGLRLVQGSREIATYSGPEAELIMECSQIGQRYVAVVVERRDREDSVELVLLFSRFV